MRLHLTSTHKGPSTSNRLNQWDPGKLCLRNWNRLTASVKASLFCSSWASRSFCKEEKCRLLAGAEKIKGKVIRRLELCATPVTFSSLHSRESEKAGNISSYFSIAICGESGSVFERNYNPPPCFPNPRTEQEREKLALALSSSTMKWQREALKKYSLALYFSRGLSIVLAPTWRQISNYKCKKHLKKKQN